MEGSLDYISRRYLSLEKLKGGGRGKERRKNKRWVIELQVGDRRPNDINHD